MMSFIILTRSLFLSEKYLQLWFIQQTFIQLMQAKIHKAKLITLHNKISDPEINSTQEPQSTGIHSYMTLLRHLILNNQNSFKNANSNLNQDKIKNSSSVAKRKATYNGLIPMSAGSIPEKRSMRDSCTNRQQILSSIMQNSPKLIQISSLSPLSQNNEGNKSQRIERAHDDEYRSFIPIGRIYHQLKHRTQTNIDDEIKSYMKSITKLKLKEDQIPDKKRLSIYSKQTKSVQRNVFRQQNRANKDKLPVQLSAKSIFQDDKRYHIQNQAIQLPTPW